LALVILDRLFPSGGRPNDASNESIAVRQYLTSMMLLTWDIFSHYAGFATRLPSLDWFYSYLETYAKACYS
jgi:hypothetical protein